MPHIASPQTLPDPPRPRSLIEEVEADAVLPALHHVIVERR